MRLQSTLLILGLTALLAVGCATNYKAPVIQESPKVIALSGDQAGAFQKVAAALVAEGYSIASSDVATGIISTQRRQMSLTPADVDVGSTWGIDYMKDSRTVTFVTITAVVTPGQVAIRSDIDAEYLPGNTVYGKRMKGVSRGTIERRIADRLR